MDTQPFQPSGERKPPADPGGALKNGADISEADLARVSGVARDVLKKWRAEKMREGEHWHGRNGSPIMITPAGVELLQTLLAGADAGTMPEQREPLKNAVAAAQGPGRYHVLVVVKIGNPRIVWARRKEEGSAAEKPEGSAEKKAAPAAEPLLRVQVRESKNFRAGMEMEKCQESTQAPGFFYYHGRLPRSFGRY